MLFIFEFEFECDDPVIKKKERLLEELVDELFTFSLGVIILQVQLELIFLFFSSSPSLLQRELLTRCLCLVLCGLLFQGLSTPSLAIIRRELRRQCPCAQLRLHTNTDRERTRGERRERERERERYCLRHHRKLV